MSLPSAPFFSRSEGGKLDFSPLKEIFQSPDLRRVLPGVFAAALLYNILAFALPLAILQIMDRVVVNQSLGTLAFIVIGVLCGLLLEEFLRAINGAVTGWLGARFEHSASVGALRHLLRVPLRRLQMEEPGVHAERIAASARVADFYSGQALLVLFDLPFVVLFLLLTYVIGGWVVLVPVVLLLVFAVVIIRFGNWIRLLVEQRQVFDDRRFNFLIEALSGIHTVKTMSMESQMERRYELLQASNAEMGERLAQGTSLGAAIGALFSQLMVVGVVSASVWAVLAGEMTPGGLSACMMLSVRSLQPLRRGLAVWLRYQSFLTARQRLEEIAEMPAEDERKRLPMPPMKDRLELQGVSLRYGKNPPLFNGLSLCVRAGECVAIRGDSGSGKSSLLALLNGLDWPDSGEVKVDGVRLSDYDIESVHCQIGLLTQNGTIISGTILQNMTMFDRSLNAAALEMSKQLGLDRVVAGLKMGYETPLGESNAETLPAGIKQLISIVRVLIRKPSVILFDEANITLDMPGDQALRAYLEKRKGESTLILVTHRPSLLNMADRVLYLEDGRLGSEPVSKPEVTRSAENKRLELRAAERPQPILGPGDIVANHFPESSDYSLCLPRLLQALGWDGDIRQLAEALPHMLPKLDISGLCSVMANLELPPRHLATRLDRLDDRFFPCLFSAGAQPAMVIFERLPDGRLRCFDGGLGEELIVEPEKIAGDLYVFPRVDPHAPRSKPAAGGSWFGNLLFRFRKHIWLVFALTVFNTLLALAPPLFVKSIFDHVLPTRDTGMLFYLSLGVLLALVLDFVLRRLKGQVSAYVGGRTEFVVGTRVFGKVINLPATATEGASVNRQVTRIRSFESLREFFLGPLSVMAFDMPANIIILVAIAILCPQALIVIMVSGILFAILAWISHRSNLRLLRSSSHAATARSEFLNETVAQIRTIRSVGCRDVWLDRFRQLSARAVRENYRDTQTQARISGASQALATATGLGTLATAAYMTIEGAVGGGVMVATMMLVWRLTGPMQNFFSAAASLIKVRSSMQQIETLMRMPMESDGGVRQTIRPPVLGSVSYSRVSFRYTNDADPALLGISFEVEPGQVMVITGPNASGKSSLLKLLARAFVPQAGTIRLDSVDIRQMQIGDLRSQITYMPQQCELFYGTVAQNLRLSNPAATDAELAWAIEMTGLRQDIDALSEGLNTRIANSRADQLPNGFKQRLALARTLLKPAPVVMLDEPGTGLDDVGEIYLQHCIEWLRGRATLLIVSHRPTHMRLADTVLVMNQGSIVAMGRYDDVKGKLSMGAMK
ncbi:MAG: ATP-binding cassette domain-containing protein [Azonexus sp.]|nr:ATP-binding cassette domain-containing protein [Azonexus sp.]MCK6413628.1 ATP-binding cassette domain-containing protein [Azonexus sp.]